MRLEKLLCAALCSMAFAASAQLTPADPDWKEMDTPPPPAFDLSRLVPFEVDRTLTLAFGVDPATISIGSDDVVRYVVVAHSPSGTVSAFYEGLRCSAGEVRTYARHNTDSGWTPVQNGQWTALSASNISRHSWRFAQQGGCEGRSRPQNVGQILRNLKNQNYEKLR